MIVPTADSKEVVMFEFIETKRHTVESVYGKPEAEVLALVDAQRYEAVTFRFPIAGETCFAPLKPGPYLSVGYADEPRLILRRKTAKRRVLTETGEVRQAHSGEMYDYYGVVMRASITTSETYPIYCESFVEVEL